jgi:hypothetical protein
LKCGSDILSSLNDDWHDFKAEHACGGLGLSHFEHRLGIANVEHDCQPAQLRDNLTRDFSLPPGVARLATKPLPTGSIPTAKTIGMVVVACRTVGTALPTVTITSTFKRTNSVAISA